MEMDERSSIEEILDKRGSMSKEEEYTVFSYYRQHNSVDLRNRIAMKNMELVYYVVNRIPIVGQTEKPDLQQEGFFGLLKAIDHFNPERGTKFSSYAIKCIKNHTIEYLVDNRSCVRIPKHLYDDYRQINSVVQEFEASSGSEPSSEQIAEILGMEEERVTRIRQTFNNTATASLNICINTDSSSGELIDLVIDENTGNEISEEYNAEVLRNTISPFLTEKEMKVLDKRFGLTDGVARTLEETASDMGVSIVRASQLEHRGIEKLRETEARNILMDF